MPQIGSDNKSVVLKSGIKNKKRILGMTGSFYAGESKSNYDSNYDKIFNKKTEFKIARETSKTFSMEQD
jgi:hypothetical protein